MLITWYEIFNRLRYSSANVIHHEFFSRTVARFSTSGWKGQTVCLKSKLWYSWLIGLWQARTEFLQISVIAMVSASKIDFELPGTKTNIWVLLLATFGPMCLYWQIVSRCTHTCGCYLLAICFSPFGYNSLNNVLSVFECKFWPIFSSFQTSLYNAAKHSYYDGATFQNKSVLSVLMFHYERLLTVEV